MSSKYQSFSDLPLMLNANDIAGILGISRAYAYNLLHAETMPFIVIGKRRMVNRDKFITWLDNQEQMSV